MSCTVEEKESKSADPEHLCQGVSPGDELCDYPATVALYHVQEVALLRPRQK